MFLPDKMSSEHLFWLGKEEVINKGWNRGEIHSQDKWNGIRVNEGRRMERRKQVGS